MSNEPIGSPFPTSFKTPRAPDLEPALLPPEPEEWRWSWSMWVGIKYGPVPVGLFIALPLIIARAL